MPTLTELYYIVPRPLLGNSDIVVFMGKIVKDRYGDLPLNPYIDENMVKTRIERYYEVISYNRFRSILVLKKSF